MKQKVNPKIRINPKTGSVYTPRINAKIKERANMLFSSRLTLISNRKGTNKNEHSPKYTILRTKLSPSKIPTNVSFTSSGTVIKALSAEDKR